MKRLPWIRHRRQNLEASPCIQFYTEMVLLEQQITINEGKSIFLQVALLFANIC